MTLLSHHYEMHVIGHQDKSQNKHIASQRRDRDKIHPGLEILVVPEPDPVLQVRGA